MRARWVLAAATALLLGATSVIAWRVLRPAEVITPATAALPTAMHPSPGSLGLLVSAPLIIDDRIRVFAKKREVWADGPAFYHYERSAYWAYRRWPAQVTGVLAVKADRPLVITAWSDGVLVAIDAGAGTVAWRAEGGGALADRYDGRRTGARTVYTPPGLFSAGSTFVTVTSQITGRAAGSGETLWTAPSPNAPDCLGTTFTTTGGQLIVHDKCTKSLVRLDVSNGRSLEPVAAGAVEPLSCLVGFSECSAMRVTGADGTVTGWLLAGASPVPLAPLHAPGSLYNGQDVVVPSAGSSSLSAVDAKGRSLWTWFPAAPAPFRLLAADRSRIVVLESDDMLVSLDPATGRFKSYASVLMEHEREQQHRYDVSQWYVSGSYLVLERTNPGVAPSAADDAYYYTNRPMLLASPGA